MTFARPCPSSGYDIDVETLAKQSGKPYRARLTEARGLRNDALRICCDGTARLDMKREGIYLAFINDLEKNLKK
ncbi:DUF6392 family protein [Klebsiella pneumoniae]|nr:DUF6392 family protein [Klebsiella pneumoniae]